MANKPDRYLKKASDRTSLVNHLLAKLEKTVVAGQEELLKIVLNDFVEGMDVDDQGNIKNTLGNKRRLTMFENVYARFSRDKGMEVVQGISEGTSRLINFNHAYFSPLATKAKLGSINQVARETVGAWLGIGSHGGVQPNGYLDTLVKDQSVKNQIKDMVFKSIVGQGGYQETKKQLQTFIAGNKDQLGALQKYYRNFAYDTYSVTDRTAAGVYANKLKLNYAIYEGGLIKTSREFCIDKNGKVFSRSEIEKFNPTEAKPPGYDPFVDLGGYGCRHHLNWIPDAVAFQLRPDLITKPPVDTPPPKPKDIAVAEKAIPKTNGPDLDPATPFDQIPDFKPKPFNPSKGQKDAVKEFEEIDQQQTKLKKLSDDIYQTIRQQQRDIRTLTPADPDYAAKMAEYQKNWVILDEVNNQVRANVAKFKKTNKDFVAEMLEGREKSPVNIEVNSPTFKKNPAFMEELKEAEAFFRVAARGLIDTRTIKVNSGATRAYMSGGNIHVHSKIEGRVIVHEFGHVLEYNNHVMKAAVEFLKKRTGNNPTKWLGSGYRRNEVYKEGGFYNNYVGKIYSGNRYDGHAFTEVVSMGLERMYADPIGFYKQDPDHFNFIRSLFFNR